MDARDITPERLAHAMRECFRLEGNKPAEARLESMATGMMEDPDCQQLVRELSATMMSIFIKSPYTHFQVLLGVGITVGMNLASQIQDLKSLEELR